MVSKILLRDLVKDEDKKGFVLTSEEIRKGQMDKVTHIIALLTAITFVTLLSYQIIFSPNKNLPDYFITIVSMVFGFYFGKNLTK